MQPLINIQTVTRINNIVTVTFDTDKSLDCYFNYKKFIYSLPSNDYVPESILVIPFVCNILPLLWIKNAKLIVNEIDKSFLYSIDEFKKGYIKMYPKLKFDGTIHTHKIIENNYQAEKNVVLFSGGIDAICTVLRHKNENLKLLTLWGSADYPIHDTKGWEIHWSNIQFNSRQLNHPCEYIKSNFCDFIPLWGEELNKLASIEDEGWWHGFQHGIGIIGHAAPYAYINKINNVYIASSFDESRKPYKCASDPSIDNFVKFGSTNVIHDGYEWNRQEKIKFIAQEINKNKLKLDIHVCLKQYQLKNCCCCEKCYRTILGLLAENLNPSSYGFELQPHNITNIINDITYKIFLGKDKIIVYQQIQKRVLENEKNISNTQLVKWMKTVDFTNINNNYPKRLKILKYKIKNKLRPTYRFIKRHIIPN